MVRDSEHPEQGSALTGTAETADFAPASVGLNGVDLTWFRAIVEASPAPILVVGTAGAQTVHYANVAFRQMSGYSSAESIGHDWTEFFVDDNCISTLSAARRTIASGRASRELLWARRRDGSRAYLKLKMSPLRGDDGSVTQCVMVLHDMTAERRTQDTLEQQAHFDALTGLANRHLLYARFDDMLSQAREFGNSFSVVLIDMNDFKMVNDCFGHETGDALLKCVGERLIEATPANDMVARLGGDEFALLLSDTHDGGSRPVTIARIIQAVHRPAVLNKYAVQPSCCFGVSCCPDDGADRRSLLAAADQALYRAKVARQKLRELRAPEMHSGSRYSAQRF